MKKIDYHIINEMFDATLNELDSEIVKLEGEISEAKAKLSFKKQAIAKIVAAYKEFRREGYKELEVKEEAKEVIEEVKESIEETLKEEAKVEAPKTEFKVEVKKEIKEKKPIEPRKEESKLRTYRLPKMAVKRAKKGYRQ